MIFRRKKVSKFGRFEDQDFYFFCQKKSSQNKTDGSRCSSGDPVAERVPPARPFRAAPTRAVFSGSSAPLFPLSSLFPWLVCWQQVLLTSSNPSLNLLSGYHHPSHHHKWHLRSLLLRKRPPLLHRPPPLQQKPPPLLRRRRHRSRSVPATSPPQAGKSWTVLDFFDIFFKMAN